MRVTIVVLVVVACLLVAAEARKKKKKMCRVACKSDCKAAKACMKPCKRGCRTSTNKKACKKGCRTSCKQSVGASIIQQCRKCVTDNCPLGDVKMCVANNCVRPCLSTRNRPIPGEKPNSAKMFDNPFCLECMKENCEEQFEALFEG
uniref:Vanadium-binding protein in plasma n=1 Tax=Ascidia sydneiensis samea TaxID=79730 RepID=Q2AAT7_ASCSS|nr:vanadium-binding protein in plasma [Ascidia sydneiensis samea]